MVNLDNIEEIKALDKENVYDSVVEFPKQCLDAWDSNQNLTVPDSYRDVNKIVMTGMGGSGLGARVIESVFGTDLPCPLIRINDYDLPAWVDEKTLVICSSFSGTTEETVENAKQAKEKGTKWMAIGTGGALIDYAKENNVPFYQINPTYNPSKQPRMAVGYSIIGQLVMTSKTGLITISKSEVDDLVKAVEEVQNGIRIDVPTENNEAKQLALKLQGKQVVFAVARHLVAAAHVAKNQMNENAKNFSSIFEIPELNHHLMEGLRFPATNKQDLFFLFFESDLYPERISQRVAITKDVVEKNEISHYSWKAKSSNKLSQAFELIQFCAFVNLYLAMINGLDPAPIPWVDYFKEQLGQPLGQWK